MSRPLTIVNPIVESSLTFNTSSAAISSSGTATIRLNGPNLETSVNGSGYSPFLLSLQSTTLSVSTTNSAGIINLSAFGPGAITTGGGSSYVNSITTDAYGRISSLTTGTPGTVTSVAMTVPSILSVSGSPVTTSGTLAVSLASQSQNLIFAGPATFPSAAPTFRSLVTADFPTSGVTAGSYTSANITVDATGRVTAASNGAGGGVTWPLTNGTSTNTYTSNVTDSSSAVAHAFDTGNAFSTAGDRLVSIRNHTTEYLGISGNHPVYGSLSRPVVYLPNVSASYIYTDNEIILSAGTAASGLSGGSGLDITNTSVNIWGQYAQLTLVSAEINFGYNGTAGAYYDTSSVAFNPVVDLTGTLGVSGHRWTETWSRRYAGVEQTIAAAASIVINPALGESVRITLGATAITSVGANSGYPGEKITVQIIQDSIGSRSISGWSGNFRLAGGSYTATTTANKRDILTFIWDSVANVWMECATRAMDV